MQRINEIVRHCGEREKKGENNISLAYEEYKRMKARIELLEILTEAENDVKTGRVAPVSETLDALRTILQADTEPHHRSNYIMKSEETL